MVAIIPETPKQAFEQQHAQQQEEEDRSPVTVSIPWWQRTIPSYALTFVIVAVASCITLLF